MFSSELVIGRQGPGPDKPNTYSRPRLSIILLVVAILTLAACEDAAGPGGEADDAIATPVSSSLDEEAPDQGVGEPAMPPTTAGGDGAADDGSDPRPGNGSDNGAMPDGAAATGSDATGAPATPVVIAPNAAVDRVITAADQGSLSSGFTVPEGTVWEFDPNADVTIEVSGNVIVNGVLRMRPNSASVDHLLKFVNVDESRFQGGGMNVQSSDIGLWVMGQGQLDLEGTARSGWLRLAGGASAGDRSITLDADAVGWQPGDEISITPTASPSSDDHYDQFDVRKITAVNGRTISLDQALAYDHPEVNGQWTAEVANLTRNVRVEGSGTNTPGPQASGRTHVFIRSAKPHVIRYVQLRHVAPRQTSDDRDPTELVQGRYGLHFHHSMDGSRGTLVEGVVIRDFGSRAFVPHASHGITIRDSIAYDGWDTGFWWDSPGTDVDVERDKDHSNDTNDLLYDHNLAAIMRSDPGFRGYGISGFKMATGQNVVIRDSVAVGIQGNVDASGFTWPAGANHHPFNTWDFNNNIAHNNKVDGIFVWQNDENKHVVSDFIAYHNGGVGIDHGAYQNGYTYQNLTLFGNGDGGINQHASSATVDDLNRPDGYHMTFENISSNGPLILAEHVIGSNVPTLYKDCSFSEVVVNNGDENAGYYDFVNCGLSASDFDLQDVADGTRVRVQNGSEAFQIDENGSVRNIQAFYN